MIMNAWHQRHDDRAVQKDLNPADYGHGRTPLSESLRSQQSVGEVEQEPRGDEGGERIVEDHGALPSELIAGVGIADRQREKSEPNGQHDQVKHFGAPSDTHVGAVQQGPLLVNPLDTHQEATKRLRALDRSSRAIMDVSFRDGVHGNVIGISYKCVAACIPAHRCPMCQPNA
jgi:hypothetical protein